MALENLVIFLGDSICAIKAGDKSKTVKCVRIIINKFRIPALKILSSVILARLD